MGPTLERSLSGSRTLRLCPPPPVRNVSGSFQPQLWLYEFWRTALFSWFWLPVGGSKKILNLKKKKKTPPPTTRNLETKPPTSTLKVKALSPGQRSHSGQQHDEGRLCRRRGNFFPVTFLLLSCPLKKWSGI